MKYARSFNIPHDSDCEVTAAEKVCTLTKYAISDDINGQSISFRTMSQNRDILEHKNDSFNTNVMECVTIIQYRTIVQQCPNVQN